MDGLSAETLAALAQHMTDQEAGKVSVMEVINTEPTLSDINSDFGTEEYWVQRWAGDATAQEHFAVGEEDVWPYIGPICEELQLCGARGAHKFVLELGAGTSRLGLDLCQKHSLNGVVVTDVAKEPMEMQAVRAEEELGVEDAHRLTTYVTDDATAMQFEDCQFGLVYDKGTNDCIRLNKDPALLARLVSEVHRVLQPRGYYVFVTCQHDPIISAWEAQFEHLQTSVISQDGPANVNIVILRKRLL